MIGFFRILGLATNIFKAGENPLLFGVMMLVLIMASYLIGSVNSAILISKYRYKDDIRRYGSGNAGLTNMNRVYGGKAATLTFIGDVLKQVVCVFLGVLFFDQIGAYIAGLFCMLGHIAPAYYHFKGGKGVLTAATMILLIDWQAFLILVIIFLLTLLISQYVSLASIIAAFAYPAVVYYSQKTGAGASDPFSLIFAIFVGCVIIFCHRDNIKRIYNNEENRFSFKKKTSFQQVLDKEDPETEREKRKQEIPPQKKKKKK